MAPRTIQAMMPMRSPPGVMGSRMARKQECEHVGSEMAAAQRPGRRPLQRRASDPDQRLQRAAPAEDLRARRRGPPTMEQKADAPVAAPGPVAGALHDQPR